jgi:predicted dehydrogenase
MKKGALGEINEAEIHYDFDQAPWLKFMQGKNYTAGDGHTFGLGTHSLDQAYVLFGRPASVTAFFRVQRGIESEVEDSFVGNPDVRTACETYTDFVHHDLDHYTSI